MTKECVIATNGKAYYITSLTKRTVKKVMSIVKPVRSWQDEEYHRIFQDDTLPGTDLRIQTDSLMLKYLKQVS